MKDTIVEQSRLFEVIKKSGENKIDPHDLINTLRSEGYSEANVLDAIQTGFEKQNIWLDSEGMVVCRTDKPSNELSYMEKPVL